MNKSKMTPRDAARRLGMRLDYLYSLIWGGRLLAAKKNGRWFVSAAAVNARLRRRRKIDA